MKFRNQFLKYMAPEQGGEAGGGAGGDEGSEQGGDEGDKGGKDGGVDLESANADLLKEVMKKKGKIQELESQLSQLSEQTNKFKDIDPELYATMLQERQEAEERKRLDAEEKLKQEGKFEELLANKTTEHEGILAQMVEKHTAELTASETKYAELETQNKALLTQIEELTVGASFGNSQFIREDLISAMTPARVRALYGSHFEPNEQGVVIGYDKPKGAEGRSPIVDAKGKPVSFDDALRTILEKQGDMDSMLRNKVNGAASSTKSGDKVNAEQGISPGLGRISHALNQAG